MTTAFAPNVTASRVHYIVRTERENGELLSNTGNFESISDAQDAIARGLASYWPFPVVARIVRVLEITTEEVVA